MAAAEYSDNEEVTDAEKLIIAKHFIMHSPNGEIDELVKDVRSLVGKKLMTPEWEADIYAKYNKSQLVMIGDVVCSKYNEKEKNKFVNPNKSEIVTVDPVKRSVEARDEVKQDNEDSEKFRSDVQSQLNAYFKKYFSADKGDAVVYANEGRLDIVITLKNLNLSNYWSGGWRSEYSLQEDGDSYNLTGRLRVNVHYFEDGNVQLNGDYKIDPQKISKSAKEGVPKEAAKAIEKIESKFHSNFDDFYVTMHEKTFKSMRRILPKTGTKMEWRSAVHKMTTEMNAS